MAQLFHVPAKLDKDQLVALLQDILLGVNDGNTLEGFVEFLVDVDERSAQQIWDVRARYRIGDRGGQGGLRVVGEFRTVDSVKNMPLRN